MFVAVSGPLTKLDPVLVRFLVFRLASGGAEDRHSLTESHHDGVVCAVEGISSSTLPSAPCPRFRWASKHHTGCIYCTMES